MFEWIVAEVGLREEMLEELDLRGWRLWAFLVVLFGMSWCPFGFFWGCVGPSWVPFVRFGASWRPAPVLGLAWELPGALMGLPANSRAT